MTPAVVCASKMQACVEKAMKRARKHVSHQIDVDARLLEQELKEAAKAAR